MGRGGACQPLWLILSITLRPAPVKNPRSLGGQICRVHRDCRLGNRVGFRCPRPHGPATSTGTKENMTTAHYSTVLDHPLETVWSLIRDFNNYPAYIEGVSESVIEDERRGDEVGAVRRFCYLGNWVRQRLAAHSDTAHSLTYAGIEPLPFPVELAPQPVSPVRYEGTMSVRSVIEGNRTFIEWSVALDAEPDDAERWHTLFQSWIPDWSHSLARALARRAQEDAGKRDS